MAGGPIQLCLKGGVELAAVGDTVESSVRRTSSMRSCANLQVDLGTLIRNLNECDEVRR